MMEKRREIVQSSTYRRFFFTYILVLIIPLMAFTLIYLFCYERIYREKILEQSETALEVSLQELDRTIQEFSNMGLQNSSLSEVQGYQLKKDIRNTFIKNLLSSQTATHRFADSIDYYTEETPGWIYTGKGGYMAQYYTGYIASDGNYCLLPDYLQEMEAGGWITQEHIVSSANEKGSMLQYVVKIAGKESSYWIFTVSGKELAKLLESQDAVTALYDREGNQLYPFEKITMETGEDFRRMECTLEDGSLTMVRFISNDDLFLELTQYRMFFLGSMLLLLILGGVFVSMLSFYSNRPVSELEERVASLEQKQVEERLLLQLLYSKNCDTEYFNSELEKVGLYQNAECFRAILISMEEDGMEPDKILYSFETLLGNKYELRVIQYLRKNVMAGLIGMKEEEDLFLRNHLYGIVSDVSQNCGGKIHIFVGGKCKKKDIHWSYVQSLLLSHKKRKQMEGSIGYFEENSREIKMRFAYPKLELDSLYDALIAADVKKVNVITDVLLDTIREQSHNRFVCTSLCCDIINTFYRAQTELECERRGNRPEIDYKHLDGIADVEDMVQLILKIREETREYMEAEPQKPEEKNIAVRVMEFINQNYKDGQLCVSMVADTFQMSISNLSHQFKALTNVTISDYITDKKFLYAKELLLDADFSVKEIAGMLGYNQTASFIRKFKQYYGRTPLEYRELYRKEQAKTEEKESKEMLG